MNASSGGPIEPTTLSWQASANNNEELIVVPAGPPPTLLQDLSLSTGKQPLFASCNTLISSLGIGSIGGVPSLHVRDAIHHFFEVLVDGRVRVALVRFPPSLNTLGLLTFWL